ncbi:hypothetical protein LCGC14_1651660 [marine sediment metagenome]|uniref:Uncharacterized protein n=1 Tax=marine sediment metagenome TaxID=412755 RepID=A0A0F9KCE5_9ZZZZ
MSEQKHILSLNHSDSNISAIVGYVCLHKPPWLLPFSKEELKQWLFPLLATRPNLVSTLLRYYDEFDANTPLQIIITNLSDYGYELHVMLKPKYRGTLK